MKDNRLAFLQRVFDRMAAGEDAHIKAKARVLISKWRTQPHMRPYYADRWTELLYLPPREIERIVLGTNAEAEELRHIHPFAGALPHAERWATRRELTR
jgi:hypothetical protein